MKIKGRLPTWMALFMAVLFVLPSLSTAKAAGTGGFVVEGGASDNDTQNIEITGSAVVAAEGYNVGAGIGGGHDGEIRTALTITGSFITTTGSKRLDSTGNANAIGGGAGRDPADLTGVTCIDVIDGAD